jgi:hypothetical protein
MQQSGSYSRSIADRDRRSCTPRPIKSSVVSRSLTIISFANFPFLPSSQAFRLAEGALIANSDIRQSDDMGKGLFRACHQATCDARLHATANRASAPA